MSGRKLARGAVGAAVMVSVLLVSACGVTDRFRNKKSAEFAFDGVEFKASARAIDKDARDHFSVEVRRAPQSLNGAKEAGRYAATRYCIQQYGTSRIEWINGPDQDNAALTLDDDTLIMEGVCKP